MFRWVSIICSLITIALFVLTGYAPVAETGCPDYIPIAATAIARAGTTLLSLQPSCWLFYATLGSLAFGCGIGLTVLLLVIHLIVAARKRAWEPFLTLLVAPPLFFSCGVLYIAQFHGDTLILAGITLSACGTFIGLLNLLFGIMVLKPARRAASAALPGAEPAPVPPLSETQEQQQS